MYITDSVKSRQKQIVMHTGQGQKQTGVGGGVTASSSYGEKAAVVELSQKGLELSEQASVKKEKPYWETYMEKKRLAAQSLARAFSKAGKTNKKKKTPSKNLSRALAIARRIMRGDKVPPKDESFLFRFNSDLYLKAKRMAMINENPKKHKSLLEEEQEDHGSASVSSQMKNGEASGTPDSDDTSGPDDTPEAVE